jgi:hypothetical protein
MNEVRLKDEPLQKPKENASVQIEGSRNLKINEEKMNFFLNYMHFYWAFYCINNNNNNF